MASLAVSEGPRGEPGAPGQARPDMAAVMVALDAITSDIKDMKTKMTSFDTKMTSLQADVDTIKQSIQSIKNDAKAEKHLERQRRVNTAILTTKGYDAALTPMGSIDPPILYNRDVFNLSHDELLRRIRDLEGVPEPAAGEVDIFAGSNAEQLRLLLRGLLGIPENLGTNSANMNR